MSTSLRGLAQDVSLHAHEITRTANQVNESATVIGVICSGDLAVFRSKVKQALQRGMEQRPDAVWVCLEPKSDRLTHDLMISLDIEPVVLPMNPEWRRKDVYDLRRTWRDLEMLHLCDELIIFHKATGNSPWRDRAKSGLYTHKLFVIDLPQNRRATKAA